MEFNRYFELTIRGILNVSKIKNWIDKNIGIEYEVDLEGDSPSTSSCGTITLFAITPKENQELNVWLDKHNYQE